MDEQRPMTQPPAADPAPLGLSAFALTTFVFSLLNAGFIAQGSDPGQQIVNLFLPLALVYGGLAQLIAGILEFRTGNTFGVAGFGSFGSFWISLAVMNLMARQGIIAETRLAEAQGWFFLAWAIFTVILLIATFGLNVGLVVTFALLLITLILLTIADLSGGVEAGGIGLLFTNIGGYVGIITALAAWYVAAADVINDTMGRAVLPVGERE
ncbi:MAG TPA: acetate uptake transporter [Rubrobacteraceae bacterium]|nr:acetate uptake transporter [Rubrobacteraceae bacterium]